MKIHDEEIVQRILSADLADSPELMRKEIHPDTTPVPYFGELRSSSVLTLGLNPSSREFPISLSDRRLVHLSDLGLPSNYYQDGLQHMTREQALEIIRGLDNYFENNPYKWFDPIERAIEIGFGASFYREKSSSRASHVDIFPWVTDNYGSLDEEIRSDFRRENESFTLRVINSIHFRYVVILGESSLVALNKQLPLVFNEVVSDVGRHESKFRAGFIGSPSDEVLYFYTSKGPSAQFRGKNAINSRMEVHEDYGRFIRESLTFLRNKVPLYK